MISPRMSCSVKFFDPTTIRFSREGPQEQSSSVRTLIMKDVIGAVFILSMRRQSVRISAAIIETKSVLSSQFSVLSWHSSASSASQGLRLPTTPELPHDKHQSDGTDLYP